MDAASPACAGGRGAPASSGQSTGGGGWLAGFTAATGLTEALYGAPPPMDARALLLHDACMVTDLVLTALPYVAPDVFTSWRSWLWPVMLVVVEEVRLVSGSDGGGRHAALVVMSLGTTLTPSPSFAYQHSRVSC